MVDPVAIIILLTSYNSSLHSILLLSIIIACPITKSTLFIFNDFSTPLLKVSTTLFLLSLII